MMPCCYVRKVTFLPSRDGYTLLERAYYCRSLSEQINWKLEEEGGEKVFHICRQHLLIHRSVWLSPVCVYEEN